MAEEKKDSESSHVEAQDSKGEATAAAAEPEKKPKAKKVRTKKTKSTATAEPAAGAPAPTVEVVTQPTEKPAGSAAASSSAAAAAAAPAPEPVVEKPVVPAVKVDAKELMRSAMHKIEERQDALDRVRERGRALEPKEISHKYLQYDAPSLPSIMVDKDQDAGEAESTYVNAHCCVCCCFSCC